MAPAIDRLDYPSRPLLADDSDDSPRAPRFGRTPSDPRPSFLQTVADTLEASTPRGGRFRMPRPSRSLIAGLSFAWALIACLGAGSITAFSLYARLFQKRLGYSQLRVNELGIAAELAMYLPVPLSGYLCDRYGPRWPSVGSGMLFGVGYVVAAFAYRAGDRAATKAGGDGGREAWPFAVMVAAFVCIGVATSCMCLAAVSTCAKNFGRGRYKGLALALPIAAFGLSGSWQSQIGSRVLYEPLPDGARGPVDVHRYFLFLGIMLLAMGVIGGVALNVVGEEEMIDEAIDELERSGLLDDSELFHDVVRDRGYGTLHDNGQLSWQQRQAVHAEMDDRKAQLERDQERKTWLLNEETRRFLGDRTMWLLAAGFFLVTGPGEAFINNLGAIIDTLVPAGTPEADIGTDAATHVSVVAVVSTIVRIIAGTLTDLLAPEAPRHQHRRGPNSLANSTASLLEQRPASSDGQPRKRFTLARPAVLVGFGLVLAAGQVFLASGLVQNHAGRFWVVSAAVGAGYGAVFSLTPIIVSVVWGVENFGTNWGIVAVVPAAGATLWGLVFSAAYEAGADLEGRGDGLCHGTKCYSAAMWGMAASAGVACVLFLLAWRGSGGWYRRGIAV